jgi:hypothetical protein
MPRHKNVKKTTQGERIAHKYAPDSPDESPVLARRIDAAIRREAKWSYRIGLMGGDSGRTDFQQRYGVLP